MLFLFPQKCTPAFKPAPLASGNAAAKPCCKSAPPRAPPFLPSPNRVRGTVADQILLSSTSEAFRPLPTVGDRSAGVPAWPCAAGNRWFPGGIRSVARIAPSSHSSDNNRLCTHNRCILWRAPGTCESPPTRFWFCLGSSGALPGGSKDNSRLTPSEISRRKTPASLPIVHSTARPWPPCSSRVQSVPLHWSPSLRCCLG